MNNTSNNAKVLVVGTTADYIEWIRREGPNRALFLTDIATRGKSAEPVPHPSEEVLADLDEFFGVKSTLLKHMEKWNVTLDGIACFDCESLELAALLAEHFSLPFPTLESIHLCRDKYASKTQWQKNSVSCPKVRLVQSPEGVYNFLQEINGSCVVKPLTGSGSELVFRCASKRDCDRWGGIIQKELRKRQSLRLYSNAVTGFLAEEFVDGDEYSCDFIVTEEKVEVIRLTRKIHAGNRPFGTISGYALMRYPPEEFSSALLEHTLLSGAKALGIDHAICMVDFLLKDDQIVLLEMTPRPGGDCIPHLLYRSGLTDILSLTLDIAQQKPLPVRGELVNGQYVGLRFHARNGGEIVQFDTSKLQEDERIREINMIRRPGHHVTLPPDDYDSWYLGYVIFQPAPGIALENQCSELSRNLVVELI